MEGGRGEPLGAPGSARIMEPIPLGTVLRHPERRDEDGDGRRGVTEGERSSVPLGLGGDDIVDPMPPPERSGTEPGTGIGRMDHAVSPEEAVDRVQEEEEEEEEEASAALPDVSHSISSRISETLAGIYDDNSLSQDFEKDPEPGPPKTPPNPPGADSTLPEEEEEEEEEEDATEPRRRVFVVDLGGKNRSESEAHAKFDGKVSLEVVTAGNAKAPQIPGASTQSRGGGAAGSAKTSRHRGRREWGAPGDSEIEEGEIVPQDDERFSPVRIFRGSGGTGGTARSRVPEPRPPRLPPDGGGGGGGDDFLSLHADSDEEGDFGAESQPDPRWKSGTDSGGGSDLRRKILTQRRLRAPPSPSKKKSKRSRERGAGSGSVSNAAAWKKPPEPSGKAKERHRRRGSRSRSRRRSWSRRSRSREKRRRRRRSGSSRHKEKHRGEKKKKKQRSRSRERRGSRRDGDGKAEKSEAAAMKRRELRSVVPPSVQELNDSDLFAIKRTITVNRRATPEPKREVLYDSEGLSFEGFSDREMPAARKNETRTAATTTERPAGREKYKKKFKEYPEQTASDGGKSKEKQREKSARKGKSGGGGGGGHKEGAETAKTATGARKVKLQSKVSVLIREGVSSTTAPSKETGSGAGSGIGVKFARDAESRAAFLKSDEKSEKSSQKNEAGSAGAGRDGGGKTRKVKATKSKGGVKKVKVKGKGEARKKRKTKVKSALKKSKADSCSQGAGTPPQLRLPPKTEPAWSGSEKSTGGTPKATGTPVATPKTPSVATPAPAVAPAERELTPDSQTVDSSCKTPDVSFLSEEGSGGAPQSVGGDGTGLGEHPLTHSGGEAQVDSRGEVKEEASRPPGPPPPPPPGPPGPLPGTATAPPVVAPGWSLQGGVDCATSGVLA
ncbi:PREDICTED: splicing factor, arginine/serine-rich 19, partial [Sturnus vulgaris]|uniref:splicing factor, arginine/serine-rich 19 n=1 Tax=Sturnus vulgaris TaxID=9172 RepID=UPI00071A0F08